MTTSRVVYRGRQVRQGYDPDRLQKHWEGVPESTIERARRGVNGRCVGCDAAPMAGGLRCVNCFVAIARPYRNADYGSDVGCGSDAGYAGHRRRGESSCRACLDAHTEATLRRRYRSVWGGA